MTRFSLSNRFLPLSFKDFKSLTYQFHAAAEQSFQTPCFMEIVALKAPKAYTTFVHEDLQANLNDTNKRNEMFRSGRLSDLTPEIWQKARHIEVTVRPVDRDLAPESYAFAQAEFKGNLPRHATFYIQPGGESVRQSLIAQNRYKAVGDGYDSNGSRFDLPGKTFRPW